jgi:hypothetical protein
MLTIWHGSQQTTDGFKKNNIHTHSPALLGKDIQPEFAVSHFQSDPKLSTAHSTIHAKPEGKNTNCHTTSHIQIDIRNTVS